MAEEDEIILYPAGTFGGDLDYLDGDIQPAGPMPIGVDIAWDFMGQDLAMSRDLQVVSRTDTIRQWCVIALATARGTEAIYGPLFGSRWRQRHREGALGDDEQLSLSGIITDALMVHDRIDEVVVYGVARSEVDPEVAAVSFRVVLDDGTEIDFPEAQF